MGIIEVVGILIFAIIVNIILWSKGFYSRKSKRSEMNLDDIKFKVGDKIISGSSFEDTIHKVTEEVFKTGEDK